MKIQIQGFGYIAQLLINCAQYNTESSLFILNFKQCAYMPVSGIYKGPN